MSHTAAQAIRRAALRLGAALVLAAPLAGCFQPVYAPSAAVDRGNLLKTIKVESVQGRMGYYLTQELRFLLNGSGEPVQPKYRLLVAFDTAPGTPLIDTVSGRASSNSLYTRAYYTMVPIGADSTTTPIAKGFIFSLADYDLSLIHI